MHSGKTTAAKYMMEYGRGQFERFAFADPLKEISAEMLTTMNRYLTKNNSPQEFTYDDMNKLKAHPPIRKLLQLVGTELGRDFFGPKDIWVNLFEQRARDKGLSFIVNDDCRFVNEAERLKELGFLIVFVERDATLRRRSLRNGLIAANPDISDEELEQRIQEASDHPSEKELDLIVPDIRITNNGGVKELTVQIERLYHRGDERR
jgi:hypothetical protein